MNNIYVVSLADYLVVAAIIFGISLAGIILNRKNLINVLMCLELMLLSVNINFVAFSHFLGNNLGEIFVFFILTVAAAESAIGLAIIIALNRSRNTIDVEKVDLLKG